MKQIPLTQGKFALVDNEDFDRVSEYSWIYSRQDHREYAHTTIRVGGRRKTLKLHSLVMGAVGTHIDHKDGNGLNNQKDNLRTCTRSQNGGNRAGLRRRCGCCLRGVCENQFHSGGIN